MVLGILKIADGGTVSVKLMFFSIEKLHRSVRNY